MENSNKAALSSFQLQAVGPVAQMRCLKESKEIAKQRRSLKITTGEQQQNILGCYDDTHRLAEDHCGDLYKELVECIYWNERRSLKCKNIRAKFENCLIDVAIRKEE